MRRMHITYGLFIVYVTVFFSACAGIEESNIASINDVYTKDLKTQLYTYIEIMSSVTDEELSQHFEVSYSQSQAALAFAKTKSKDHVDIIIEALEHNSPLVRSAALDNIRSQTLFSPKIVERVIEILHRDPVRRLQRDSIGILSSMKALSACPDLLSISQSEKQRIIKRSYALDVFVSLKCPGANKVLIAFFKTGEIYKTENRIRSSVISAFKNYPSPDFAPYLIAYNESLEKVDSSVFNALGAIGGQEIEKYLVSLIKNDKRDIDYKYGIVDDLLKLNKPEIDSLIVFYLSKMISPKNEYSFYNSLGKYFEKTKRHQKFVEFFIEKIKQQSNNTENFQYKTPIAFMLKGVIQPKHLNSMKLLITNEKKESVKCILLNSLVVVKSLDHYDFMLSFNDEKYQSNCRYSAIKYLGNTETKNANNYVFTKYKNAKDIYLKISYVKAIGKYQSKENKAFLINVFNQSKNVTERLEAIRGLSNQIPNNDWDLIESLYLKVNKNTFKRAILKSVANYDNPEALEILISAYKIRRYHTTVGPLLLKKGYTEKQLNEIKSY